MHERIGLQCGLGFASYRIIGPTTRLMIPDGQSLNQATAGRRGTIAEKALPYRLSAGAAMTIHISLMTPEIRLLVTPHDAPAAQRQTAAAARANGLLRRRGRSFEWLSFQCLRDFHEYASVPTPLYSIFRSSRPLISSFLCHRQLSLNPKKRQYGFDNFLVNVVAGLIAYTYQPTKPSLTFQIKKQPCCLP